MSPERLRHLVIMLAAVVLALGLGFGGLVAPGEATAQDQELIVNEQDVVIDYPSGITFSLDVEAPDTIEQVELRYQPVFSQASRAERPDFEPGSNVDTSYSVDLRTNYLPPGLDIDYRWIITLEDGRQLETPQQQFFFIDNRYDWTETAEGSVSIYNYAGGSQLGELAMDVTQRTIDRFGSDFDVQLDEPINIILYGSVSEFQEALPYNSPEWIGGFADPGQNLIVAGISPGEGAATEMGRMLTHEVIHLLVAQATLNPFNGPPRWLDEGLAINYQEVQEDRFRRVLDQAIDEGRLIPVPALRSSFPSDPDLAIQSYAQSESIVEFLIEEHGHEPIARLLAVYQDGVSHREAVEIGLGMTLEELDAAWKAWLGYDGDDPDALAGEPASPGLMQRTEDVLSRTGVMPVLVIGGAIVVIMGVMKIVRAVNVRELDEDVGPEVEYYGQDLVDRPEDFEESETFHQH